MIKKKTYQETLDYLYKFVDYSLTRTSRYSPDQFDLARMQDFMDYLDNPQRSYPIIHIAGTKGKGSVSALCASTLQCAGYLTGLYTSPHLEDYSERIQINGKTILPDELIDLVEEVRPYLDQGTRLTTFEITTALAFLYFARKNVTAVVAEVGLGGRLDATNIVTPVVSIITSLSFDHSEFLGYTLAAIAGEKAGIIKPGVPVVISPQNDEARLVIERVARENEARIIKVGKDFLFAPARRSLKNQTFLVWSASEQSLVDAYIESGGIVEWEPTRLTIPLLGYHQVENAATAYAALMTANNNGLAINSNAIVEGFAMVQWPARFEVLQLSPPVIIDSAHNRDSALKLRLALDDYFPGQYVILIFGVSEDKDVEGMFAELMPRVNMVIATRSVHPRSMDPDQLVNFAHRYGKQVKVTKDVEEALGEALQLVTEDAMILVAGSIFVAAGVRHAWNQMDPFNPKGVSDSDQNMVLSKNQD